MAPEAVPTAGKSGARDALLGVPPAATVTVHIAPGSIYCAPQGGNVHVCKARAAHAIRWRGDTPFKLEFTTFDEQARPVWPFAQVEPDWPARDFTATPPGGATTLYYKYSSSAAGLFLDPIVIVDK